MRLKTLLMASAAVAVAGCSHISYKDRQHKPEDAYMAGLMQGYLYLADWENEQGDFLDANIWEEKVRQIVKGQKPELEVLDNWSLPAEHLNELAQARNYLNFAMANGAAEQMPEVAAEAQWRFDCWVEQQEENFQPDHIADCKEAYKIAEAKLRGMNLNEPKFVAPVEQPAVETQPAAIMPNEFIVFFDFDSANLGPAGKALIKDVVAQARAYKPSRIAIAGSADRAGNSQYNMNLSMKRAAAVATVLKEHGVSPTQMLVQGLGEDAPRVSTKDGVRNRENRYVTIRFIK